MNATSAKLVCMYVRMYVYMYVCMSVCLYVCMSACMYVSTNLYVCRAGPFRHENVLVFVLNSFFEICEGGSTSRSQTYIQTCLLKKSLRAIKHDVLPGLKRGNFKNPSGRGNLRNLSHQEGFRKTPHRERGFEKKPSQSAFEKSFTKRWVLKHLIGRGVRIF